MAEDAFVGKAMQAAGKLLEPPLSIRRGAALLYEVTVSNRLELTVNPKQPKRGRSAFQTDLCVFEELPDGTDIPRVVMEFKSKLTTHDVLTYSTKAHKHKQVYPYLRYGLVVGRIEKIPGRFFTHNEGMDFCVAAAAQKGKRIHDLFSSLLEKEVNASRRLEKIIYGTEAVYEFRNEVLFKCL